MRPAASVPLVRAGAVSYRPGRFGEGALDRKMSCVRSGGNYNDWFTADKGTAEVFSSGVSCFWCGSYAPAEPEWSRTHNGRRI